MKKTLLSLAAVVSISLVLTSCGGGQPAPQPQPQPTVDTTAPSVVSVTPSSGATGVSKDANVVVTFSEPMDQASAQAAFQSADLGTTTFSWNADGTVLTVNPNVDLTYTAAGKSHSFKVTTTAKDKANNALSSETSSSFKTFKQLSKTITSTAALDGDVNNSEDVNTGSVTARTGDGTTNRPYRTFFSFDISSLPTEALPANVLSATLKVYQDSVIGTPYKDLNSGVCLLALSEEGGISAQALPPLIPIIKPIPIFSCDQALLEHVNYGSTLTGADFETPILSTLTNLSSSTTLGLKTENVLAAVKDDLDKRAARGNRSQYRVRFPVGTDTGGDKDYAMFSTADAPSNRPTLEITYLIP